MLSDTITLNVGAVPADRVFNLTRRSGNESVYYADSDDNDLAGRIELRIAHEFTTSGLVKSLVQFVWPQKDADGVYSSAFTSNMTLIRPNTADLTLVDEQLEMAQEIWAITDFRSDIGNGES